MKRHYNVANVAFADGSVRSISIPDLWTLDWYYGWQRPTKLPKPPWMG